MNSSQTKPSTAEILAPMFAALGQPARLEIMRLLLSAYPQAVPAGRIQEELDIPASTLSHHLHRLREVGLVEATRESQWIRYGASSGTMQSILDFLYSECCTRNTVVDSDLAGRCC